MSTAGVNFLRSSDGHYDPEQFDLIYVSCADLHGVARGRFVTHSCFPGVVKNGLGMTIAALYTGIKQDIPIGLTDMAEEGWSSGIQMPDMKTLRPMSWLSTGRRKIGSVICDFDDASGKRVTTSSRELAMSQIRALKDMGFEPLVSAVAEYTLFYRNTVRPVLLHENLSSVMCQLIRAFDQSDIRVLSVGLGLEPGKLQITMKEQPALTLADDLYRLHGAVRSICGGAGYDITFMTKALPGISSNSTKYTWRLIDCEQRNVFSADEQGTQQSSVCSQWLAGQLKHNSAICALARPTVNCYREDKMFASDGMRRDKAVKAPYSADSISSTSRIKLLWEGDCLKLQDNIASSASNPYFVIASVIAAGIHGITNNLQHTQRDVNIPQTPKSLQDALESLECDEDLKRQLGSLFVEYFLYLKTDFEVKRFQEYSLPEQNQDGAEDRAVYLMSL